MLKKIYNILILLMVVCSLEAREPYRATITVDADSATVNDPNLVDLKRALRTSAIQKLDSHLYTDFCGLI